MRNKPLLVLTVIIGLSLYQTIAQAVTPVFVNVTDNKETIFAGDNVTFTGYWESSDNVRLLIADNVGFTNCNYSTHTGCMCFSDSTTANTSSCQHTVQKTDPTTFIWYGRICNSGNECTPVVREYNFTGITNPSSTHKAFYGISSNKPPSGMVTGTEAGDQNYSDISASDDVRWYYYSELIFLYEWKKFEYNISVPTNSINFVNVTHEGWGASAQPGLEMYIWNSTGAWDFVDNHSANAMGEETILKKEMFHGFNFSQYLNENNGYIKVLVITGGMTGEAQESVYTDQARVVLTIGGSFLLSGRDFQVSLTMNNTDANVYIPSSGADEVNSGSLGTGTTYTSPDHFYMASYIGNALTGLVASVGNYIFVSNTSTSHTLKISQNLTPQDKIFLVLTKGDWSDIDKRMGLVESGGFSSRITPTFGFGLGILYPVKLLMNYAHLDIRGNLILNRGMHKIIIDYNETTSDNRPVLYIK